MTSEPPRRVRPSAKKPSTGRFWLLMLVGGALCLLGVYWAFQSYSSHPTKFYFGIAFAVIGAITGLVGALRAGNAKRR